MKQVEKPIKYILTSGDEEIMKSTSIQGMCDHLGCHLTWVYANRYKNINKDGSWSFNLNNYNYTIKTV